MLCKIVNGCVVANSVRYREGSTVELIDSEAVRLELMGVVKIDAQKCIVENEIEDAKPASIEPDKPEAAEDKMPVKKTGKRGRK